MARLRDWERRYHAWYADWQARAHVWGESDCGCMVAANIMAVTGCPDPMAELRGRYSTAAGNRRQLKRLGFDSPAEFVASKFTAFASPALARRGDIGVCETIEHGPLVVVLGHTIAGIGPSGLIVLPRQRLTRAFIIG